VIYREKSPPPVRISTGANMGVPSANVFSGSLGKFAWSHSRTFFLGALE
jgi:hypothetical protein